MDEEQVETDVPSVGERLRAAREEKGISLEEIAAQTRIPRRHLESIEAADWDKLPAPTYTIGFARSYAAAIGLDRTDIASQLRGEMGGARTTTTTEVFEPADPARTMPKGLVIGAILAVIVLVLVMSWLSRRSLEQSDEPATNSASAPAAAATQPPATPPSATAAAQGPVVLAATDAVWFEVYEKGGATLFSGLLQPGQTYTVPATATAPLLRTGKPEALRVTVGNAIAPALGPAATKVSDVSLLPADLLKAGQAPAASPPQPTPAAPAPRPASERPRSTNRGATAPQPAPPPTPAPTNNAAAI
jgi:cytoskeleton protein RodZ